MIVPLGGAYLELVAVADPGAARGTAFGGLVAAAAGKEHDLGRLGGRARRLRRRHASGSTRCAASARC
ncbi:hypothetical protein DSM104299_03845 [Baekduia alba]|nr:hypothetical protein [Baekduia alba]WCB95103.1 hypothetical protein DSM104299_03845 [Baekduia alba]